MDPIPLFFNKKIVLGVTGSIAAYKAADLASKLHQAGAQVDVILTEAAARFVTPLTFQAVTGRPALSDLWAASAEAHVAHVALAEQADLLLIAPATATTIAKLAHGLADNLLTVTALAARGPVLVAPAMDGGMFAHPATQANLETLAGRGVTVLGPAEGRMASGLIGRGRMLEPEELFGQARLALGRGGPLAARRIVVSAGGTQEPLDPVRFISNRSSGKQGYALAQAALDKGAAVTLISGPTALAAPVGATVVAVQTAQEMAEAVLAASADADALLMAAAVADFRPAAVAEHKLKKNAMPEIRLEKTVDILSAVAEARAQSAEQRPTVVVGFAAESQNLLENARDKAQRKRLNLIAANNIAARDAGFSVDTNRVTLIDGGGGVEELPLLTKAQVADVILSRVERYFTPQAW
ncbi:MAG: bifunctional phosphopantothenoylcysteine decarboxylase/phosphopantothenate--cysteine ligase CoaBC [Anaerolineales bacterium]|nr:bifunctional phosphopantothenoylcysteine decarboxylase/phosphopantothenate--cysteine ligase CoaBC [Anaerolineales bacterium]